MLGNFDVQAARAVPHANRLTAFDFQFMYRWQPENQTTLPSRPAASLECGPLHFEYAFLVHPAALELSSAGHAASAPVAGGDQAVNLIITYIDVCARLRARYRLADNHRGHDQHRFRPRRLLYNQALVSVASTAEVGNDDRRSRRMSRRQRCGSGKVRRPSSVQLRLQYAAHGERCRLTPDGAGPDGSASTTGALATLSCHHQRDWSESSAPLLPRRLPAMKVRPGRWRTRVQYSATQRYVWRLR